MLPTPPRLPCADELDEYIDDHAAEFVVYEPGGEQQLGWHDVHLQYVALVEGKIHEFLGQLGAAPDGLYAVLAEVAGGDARADAFLERVRRAPDGGRRGAARPSPVPGGLSGHAATRGVEHSPPL